MPGGSLEKCERLMDLIVMLSQTPRPLTFADIAAQFDAYRSDKLESAKRTFERDKAELLELGIPLRCIKRGEDDDLGDDAYVIDRDRYQLPDLHLTAEERAVLGVTAAVARHHVGLSHARQLGHALRKLSFAAVPREAGLPVMLHFPTRQDGPEARRVLEDLEQAITGRKRVTLRYHAESTDAESARTVDPYGLVYRRGTWLLVGHCHLRRAVRLFRTDRIVDVKVAPQPKHPDFERPADFRVEDYVHISPWKFALGEAVPVTLAIAPELGAVAEEDFGPRAEVSVAADGSRRVRFQCANLSYLTHRVLAAAGRLWVIEPEPVRARIAAAAGAIAAVYGGAR
jgi:proteasome accessory factor B